MDLKDRLILAPMAGYSDLGFKMLCEKYGASATISEMISAKAIYYESEKTNKMLINTGLNKTKGVQIFGNDPIIMSGVIKQGTFDSYDFIDINMGCPAPKIVKNKEGSHLLKDLTLASKIISECVKVTNKPISVKFRLGIDDNHLVGTEFAKMCEESGAKLITIHGRTVEQKYSGNVNLEEIKKIKDSVKIKVCGNGDVVDKLSLNKMLQTGVDYVMIGRGAIGNPYIFSELLDLKYEKNLLEDIIFHYNKIKEIFGEEVSVNNMKKHLAFYLKGKERYKEILTKIYAEKDFNVAINLIEDFLKRKD